MNGAATFHPLTGTFGWEPGRSRPALVTAPDACPPDLLAWTTRAVERAGYRVGPGDHAVEVAIRAGPNGDAPRWLIGSRELDSLAALVAFLRAR